jgi:hypothetical protein
MVVPIANAAGVAPKMSSPLESCSPELARTATRTETDERCALGSCAGSVLVAGCEITVANPGCPSDGLRGRIWPDGSLCLEDNATCTSSTPEIEPPWARTICAAPTGPACAIDLLNASTGPGLVLAARGQIIDAPAFTTDMPDVSDYVFGYLGDALVIGDHLVVVTNAGEFSNRWCGVQNTDLRFYDLDLRPLGPPVPAPRCTERLLSNPEEVGGFFGISGSPTSTLTFERFRPDGTRVATAALALPHSSDRAAMNLLPLGRTGTVAALLRSVTSNQASIVLIEPAAGRVRELDLSVLTRVPLQDAYAMVVYARDGAPWLAVTDNMNDRVLMIDPAGQQGASIDAPMMHVHGLGYDAGTGRFLVADASAHTIWVRSDHEPSWAHLTAHPESALPWALEPLESGGLLAAGWMEVESNQLTAAVSLVDPRAPRSLAGRVRIGTGPVASIRSDAQGRLFAVLSWAGQIVRLDPR